MVAPGPNISLRAYSVVPRDSPIFECVKTGDVDKMFDLFRQGAASPLDVDQYGRGLFQVTPRLPLSASILILAQTACRYGNISTMIILRQLDIRCLEMSQRYSWISECLYFLLREGSVTEAFCHFLLQNGAFHKEDYDSDEQWDISLWNSQIICASSPNAVRLILPYISPDHHTLSAYKRLGSVHLHRNHPISLRLFLQPDGSIIASDIRELQQQGLSLAVLVALLSTAQTGRQTPPTNHWRRLRRDTIAVTESLSFRQGPLGSLFKYHPGLSHQPIGTAFSAIIVGTLVSIYDWADYETKNEWIHQLNTALQNWLEDLSIAGVDLAEYGRIEEAILSSLSPSEKSFIAFFPATQHPTRMPTKRWNYYQIGHIKLESFTYGPKPTDWSYVWDYPTENFSGEFWEMIDNVSLKVPGSWVEDSDSDDSSSYGSDEWGMYG